MNKGIALIVIIHVCLVGQAQILKVDKGRLLLDSSNMFIGNLALNFDVHNKSANSEEEITFVGLKGSSDFVYLNFS